MRILETRIPPPVVMLATAAAMWLVAGSVPGIDMPRWVRWTAIAGLAAAAVIAPLGLMEFARAKTTHDPLHVERASSLVTTGVFGFTRNPMYLAMTSLLTAWAVHLSSPWLLLGPLAFALYITRFQIMPEERAMAANFGAAYDAYRARVRRWI